MGRCYPFTAPLLAVALLATPPASFAAPAGSVGDLYVTGDISNTVRVYDDVGFNFLGLFTTTTNMPLGIHFGATNGRVLVGGFSNGVLEYDVATGAFIKAYGGPLWQWSGVYAPNGNVLVAASALDQIHEYDANTGAFIQLWSPCPGAPADMRYGPNGNLYVCTFNGGMVFEFDPNTAAIVSAWSLPVVSSGPQANDVEFLNGEILVTDSRANRVWRFDSTPAHNVLGWFTDANWGLVHGIKISPHNGHIYVCDGASAQVYEFDPLTFALINANVLTPGPGDKVVDIEFRPGGGPTPAMPTSWGRIKSLYR